MARSFYPVEVRTHTALNVVKGAVVHVLGPAARWTASTHVSGSHGRLTVRFNRKPVPEEVAEVERLANQAVEWGLPVETVELPREEAEARWADLIYDLFPVPEEVKALRIVIIRDPEGGLWNINACNREHTASTGCIGGIKLGEAEV